MGYGLKQARSAIAGVLSTIAFIPMPAQASEWVFILSSQDKTTHSYIDASSIVTDENGMITYWTKMAKTPYSHYQNKLVKDSTVLYQADCPSRRFHTLQLTVYYSDGTSESDSSSGKWEYAIPDTLGEALFTFACTHKP